LEHKGWWEYAQTSEEASFSSHFDLSQSVVSFDHALLMNYPGVLMDQL